MRVLHIITGLSTGGAETMLFKLLSGIDKNRFHCAVVSLSDTGTLGPGIVNMGIPVYALNMRPGTPNIAGLLKLGRIIRKFRPNLVQGWMPHGNLMALLSVIFTCRNVPVVWNIRQSLYSLAYETPGTARLIRLAAKLSWLPKAIVYNSAISASQHEALGYRAGKRLLIPNGFDCQRFAPNMNARIALREKLGIAQSAILIGLAARFHPMKDHASFLRAAALLARERGDIHFVLAGAGVDSGNQELTQLIQSLGVEQKAHLLGEVGDMPGFFAALDIATSSSITEAFPNAVGEAMACAVPCVVTDVGASGYIVGDSGLVILPNDPAALVYAWRKLLALGAEMRGKLGNQARHRILDNFSLDAVVAQYENLYHSLRSC